MGFLDFLLPGTKRNAKPAGATPSQEVTSTEFNTVTSGLNEVRNAVVSGEMQSASTAKAVTGIVRRNSDGRYEVSESVGGADRWRRLSRGAKVYDITESHPPASGVGADVPGALPGQANKTRTFAAIQNIFDTIRHKYADEGSSQSAQSAVVKFPFDGGQGWWVDQGLLYQGSTSAGLYLIGELGLARGGKQGTSLVYDGTAGGTFFDMLAINGSVIKDLEFNGNRKARKLFWMRQKSVSGAQVGVSSGVQFFRCSFVEPELHADSILVPAGNPDNPPDTYQSSEYRFYQCYFQGSNDGTTAVQRARGFVALVGGNTKNFVFSHCAFIELHRGVEASSGYVFINECNASNIGGYGFPGAALFFGGGNAWTILGGGMENGNPGYAAKFVSLGQLTKCNMIGCYLAGTTYADDVIVKTGGGTLVQGCDFQNSRNGAVGSPSTSRMVEWAAATAYTLTTERFKGTNAYRVITAGTSAGSGGPSGTGSDITDGTVHWEYAGPRDSNVMRVQATNSEVAGQVFGSMRVQDCSFFYNTAQIYTVPFTDGGGANQIGAPPGGDGDFSRISRHKIYASGNNAGLVGGNIDKNLKDFAGDFEEAHSKTDEVYESNNDSGVTVVQNQGGWYQVTIPYTAFTSGALSQNRYFGTLRFNRRISSVKVQVTTGFTHSGGATVGLKIGTRFGNSDPADIDDDSLIVSFNPSATGTKGVLESEWGTPMQNGAGGYHTVMSGGYGSVGEALLATITVSTGTTAQLTAGVVTVYVKHERLGAQT